MKIREFRKSLKEKQADIALLFSTATMSYNPNLFYFTSYKGFGCLAVPTKMPPFFLVPKMEIERARDGLKATKQLKRIFALEKKKFLESIDEILKRRKIRIKKIGIDKNSISVNEFSNFKKFFPKKNFFDISQICQNLRVTKTEKEIYFLKKACNYGDSIIKNALSNFKEFKTESDVSSYLEYLTKKHGLELSFPPIVASGNNSAIPHYEPKNSKLKKGFCVIDFGVKYKGYCSDMTRTVFIGKPTRKEKETYSFLLNVQNNIISEAEENKSCAELYGSALKHLGKYKKYFTHGLGHGVGVEIHELPNLTLNSPDKIKNSMVFTVEPGIYIPKKFGIRIEDTILFQNKISILTKTSKDLIII